MFGQTKASQKVS